MPVALLVKKSTRSGTLKQCKAAVSDSSEILREQAGYRIADLCDSSPSLYLGCSRRARPISLTVETGHVAHRIRSILPSVEEDVLRFTGFVAAG